jgi:hypothetical protein
MAVTVSDTIGETNGIAEKVSNGVRDLIMDGMKQRLK